MLGEPAKQIAKEALTVWRIRGIIASVISLLVFISITVTIFIFDWPKWLIACLVAIWLIESYFVIIFSPTIRWRRWRYEVREQEIEIQHGLFIIKKTLIPMIRVQHVDNTQGPLLKKYHLSNIQISTAATTHEIPALYEEEAEELRHTISRLARVEEEDV